MSGPLDHLSMPEITGGASIGLWDSITSAVEQQFRVDSQLGFQTELQNRWNENLELLQQETGQTFDRPLVLRAYTDYTKYLQQGGALIQPGLFRDVEGEVSLRRLADTDNAIRDLGSPNVKSFAQVLDEVIKMQQEVEARSNEVSERGSIVGQFIGAAAGSFTPRDPIALATLPVGGFGRTVAARVASEMVIAGGVVGATEAAFVQPNRELAGLPERSLLWDVGAAAVGAGVLRGGFEAIGAGVRRLRQEELSLDFSDDQLRSMFETAPESPRARAAVSILDDVQQFEATNPYGATREGELRFDIEMQPVLRAMQGQAETAVARFIPPIAEPQAIKLLDADTLLVKGERPLVYDNFVAAEQRLNDIDAEISAAELRVDSLSRGDAIARIDEDSGNLVRSFEQDLREPGISAQRRRDIEQRIERVVESLGPDAVARATNDVAIAPRKDLQRLRKERRAAKARYVDARKSVDNEIVRLRAEQRVKEMVQQTAAIRSLPASQSVPLFPFLRHGAVEEVQATVGKAAGVQEETAIATIARQPDDDGMVDIGLAEPVPASFALPVGDGRSMTIAEILDDLKDDEALEAAMRTCAL